MKIPDLCSPRFCSHLSTLAVLSSPALLALACGTGGGTGAPQTSNMVTAGSGTTAGAPGTPTGGGMTSSSTTGTAGATMPNVGGNVTTSGAGMTSAAGTAPTGGTTSGMGGTSPTAGTGGVAGATAPVAGNDTGGATMSTGGTPEVGGAGADPVAGATSTGGSGDGSGCANAAVCDDFESGTLSADWIIQMDSTPAPEIDSAKGANGSSSSLKTTGTSQQSFVAREVPGQAFYTRAYMNFEQSTAQMTGHGWFIVGATNVTSGNEEQMRFGSSGNHGHNEIDFNVYGPSCGGEKTQFSDGASDGGAGWQGNTFDSVLFDANTWYCVEAFFNGPGNEFQLWVDGEEVPGLHVTEATMCAGWSPTYTHIKFGAGANSTIGAIWYDDVAVSQTRVGCE
jgi:hypothetical protein